MVGLSQLISISISEKIPFHWNSDFLTVHQLQLVIEKHKRNKTLFCKILLANIADPVNTAAMHVSNRIL